MRVCARGTIRFQKPWSLSSSPNVVLTDGQSIIN
jgi:hypothetical protein